MADQLSTNVRPGRVMLWANPRTIGTAFCKCMSGIPDCEIWYENYGFGHYAVSYMKTTENVNLPMEYEGNEQMFERAADILSPFLNAKLSPELLPYATTKRALEKSTSKYVFVKDESYAMASDLARQYLPVGFKHSFIIRHPILVFTSFRKAEYKHLRQVGKLHAEEDENTFDMRKHEEVLELDSLIEGHYNMWKFIQANIDPNPIIIDSDDLLTKPAETLSKYCKATGLPYSDSLLKWDGSIESGLKWKMPGNDLIYNPSFLGVSMTSTHFTPPGKPLPRDQLTDDVIEVADKAMPFYQEMYENRMGALP